MLIHKLTLLNQHISSRRLEIDSDFESKIDF